MFVGVGGWGVVKDILPILDVFLTGKEVKVTALILKVQL